jgi:MraZ protein
MFYGEYEHAIDDKNRLTLPARFRDAVADGIVLTRGQEGCIAVYPRDRWESATARIAELDPLSRDARDLQRFVFAGAAVVEPDKQGRVVIPAHLLVHAGIDKEVVLAGVQDRLEIWNRSVWNSQLTSLEGRVGDVAERLAQQRG